ncbi:MAG: copper resistance protein NlpE [Prevotella sp.]|jgi:uncharacterized lipoprotein NlpE involved in copper resistance|nr:copper resistance protein NlpE [Prevotella sp.]
MKKLFILIAATGMLYSCGGNTQKTQEKTTPEAVQAGDEHNAKNSLDYRGTYTAEMPTAGGAGMMVSITLEDSTYVKKTEYIGEKGILEDKGKYTWNAEGNTVILDGIKDAPNQYLVGENTLTQLDMEGKKITGELADQYILKK